MRYRRYARLISWVILLWVISVCTGCRDTSTQHQDPALIWVNEQFITVNDFKAAFEIAKTAYSTSALKDTEFLHQIRMGVLSQLTDELVLLNRACELGLSITDEELENAVQEIQADYPDDTFNQTLVEASIPLSLWKDGLKKRLLLEKVIKADLEDRVSISPGDIDEFFTEKRKSSSVSADLKQDAERVLRQLKRKKAQDIYRSWINDLRSRYTITINEELLEKIKQS